MADSLPIDIFHNANNQTANIGLDNDVKTSSDVYFNSWYLEDVNAQPFARLSFFIGEDVSPKTVEVKNPIRYYNNKKNEPYFINTTSPNWSIGWGTPECKWSVPNGYFCLDGFLKTLLSSGNGKAYNNTYERVAFQVVRWSSADNDWGDVWIKKYVRVKPNGKMSINLSSDFGVITKANPNLTVECKFNDSIGNYLPETITYQYCKIEILQGSTVVKTYYPKRSVIVTKSGTTYNYLEGVTEWTMPVSDFNTLTTGVYYSIRVTPGILYKNTFYSYSDRSVTKSNVIMRDPTPKSAAFTIEPTSIGTVRDFNKTDKSFTYKFNDNGNGILNKVKFELSATDVNTINLGIYGGTAAKDGKINIPMSSLVFDKTYTLTATLYYSDSIYSTKTLSSYITSSPTPLNTPVNTTSITNPYDSESVKITWTYDNSKPKDKGIANGYTVALFNGSVQVASKDVNLSTQSSNSGGSCTFDTTTLPKGTDLKLVITPYFVATINGSTSKKNGPNPLTVNYFIRINYGMEDIIRNAPYNTNAKWFFGDTDTSEKSTFRIAFTLPTDKNYKYLSDAEKAAYRYAALVVTYEGLNGIKDVRVYNIGQNSTVGNPTWISVSGSGELTHNNTCVIDLTGIYIQPDSNNKYKITIQVVSQYGTSKETEYTIELVDFPILMEESDPSIASGTVISASSFNKFFDAKTIVDTYLNPKEVKIVKAPLTGDYITYENLKDLVSPINSLYKVTKDWTTNLKRYEMPRSISSNGTLSNDAPYYQKKLAEVSDHIYTIKKEHINLSQLSTLPSDYSDKYNKYFQRDKDYAFRSADSNVPNDPENLYSATEYNVLWSYYLLYRRLHTNTLPLDWYLKQTTDDYTYSDSQSHGGWISISDIQLDSNYTYELDADLLPGTLLTQREWTAFGGSYTKLTYYEGLFCYIGNGDGLLHLSATGGTLDASTPITIEAGRTTYRFEPTIDLNYIRSTVYSFNSTDYQAYSSYIYVPIDLYTDYTYEITANVLSHGGRIYSILGGSTATGRTFIGANGDTFYDFANGTLLETMTRVEGDHTYIFNGNGSHTLCADGGFFLMAVRDYQTGERILGSYGNCDSFFEASGRVIEVKIKDGNGDLIMDFVPESNNGNFGFRDKLSDTFYAAADNSKFLVSTHIRTTNGFMIFAPKDYSLQDGKILGAAYSLDSLYGVYGKIYGLNIYDESELIHKFVPHNNGTYIGMIDKVTGVFYPCNDDSKFYMLKEGQEPVQLNMLLGTPDNESDPEEE